MRAVRYDRYGPPEVLHVADIDEPAPGPGEVKLRVRAASLNPLDGKVRAGHLRWVPGFARPPRGTGVDVAGEIVAVGSGAAPRHMGERVFGSISPLKRDGAFAEFAVAPAANLVAIPAGSTSRRRRPCLSPAAPHGRRSRTTDGSPRASAS